MYLNNLAGLHGQSGEVSSAVNGDSLPQDRVQAPHLIPRQHTEPPTQIRRITARHGEVNFVPPSPEKRNQTVNPLRCVTSEFNHKRVIPESAERTQLLSGEMKSRKSCVSVEVGERSAASSGVRR